MTDDTLIGEWDTAAGTFEDAAVVTRTQGWRPLTAAIELEHARMLLRRGRPQDRATADALAGAGLVTARTLGLVGLLRRSRAPQHGVRP